ncbi:MAG: hypothetical protein JOZ55_03630 [Alphaproteobacteria bacterium]|nr:hypothetical protein [Alphaproteobacteria bacterium]
MKPDKDTLCAFVDGELGPEETSRIASLVEADPEMKAYVEAQEHLRRQLRDAFAGVLAAPVPDALVGSARTSPLSLRVRAREWFGGAATGGGVSLRFAVPVVAAVAGVFIGIGMEHGTAAADFGASSTSGRMVAQNGLAAVLDQRLASDAQNDSRRVGITFRDKSGVTCRSFSLAGAGATTDGFACRQSGEWQVGALSVNHGRAPGGGYELAGSEMPDAIRTAIAQRIEGDPFDARAERQARDKGWN